MTFAFFFLPVILQYQGDLIGENAKAVKLCLKFYGRNKTVKGTFDNTNPIYIYLGHKTSYNITSG